MIRRAYANAYLHDVWTPNGASFIKIFQHFSCFTSRFESDVSTQNEHEHHLDVTKNFIEWRVLFECDITMAQFLPPLNVLLFFSPFSDLNFKLACQPEWEFWIVIWFGNANAKKSSPKVFYTDSIVGGWGEKENDPTILKY